MKVQCLVCGEKFSYDEGNTGVLIDHLNRKHSGTEVFRYLAGGKGQKSHLTSFHCHQCSKIGRPILKKKGGGKPGPFNVIWCWPLCCATETNRILNIYCSYCGQYGGFYDRKTGKVVLDE